MGTILKILCRKFEPFERLTAEFVEEFKTMCKDFDAEIVSLHLPELHDTIIRGDFDVAHVNTDWVTQGWETGVLENLKPYIDNSPPEDYPDGWDNALLKLQTFENGIAGIPFHNGPECLIYRKDLFESEENKNKYSKKYGKELKPPQTWDDFCQIADFFNRPDENLYGTLFALYPDGHNNIFDYALQVWSRGGDLVDEKGDLSLNSPTAVSAMEAYRKLIRQPYVHPKSKELESIGASWTFAAGEVAMMVNWFGFAAMCETVSESKVKGKVEICPIPCENEQLPPVSLNVYYTWSVCSRSDKKQMAYDFIKNCVTKANDKKLPLGGAIGCRKSTWYDSDVNALIPYYSNMGEIHKYARTLPKKANWHDVSVIIDEMVLKVIDTDESVKAILDGAQKKLYSRKMVTA